jgi:hypothetical protein
LRFRLPEVLRPLELPLLLSLGAWVEESLSTRLDSVRAPDLLWVSLERLDPELLDPDPRLREPALERPFAEEERLRDFEEEPLEPPERLLLLLDEDLRWGILPFIPPESLVNRC